jgi:hypothetical protein
MHIKLWTKTMKGRDRRIILSRVGVCDYRRGMD